MKERSEKRNRPLSLRSRSLFVGVRNGISSLKLGFVDFDSHEFELLRFLRVSDTSHKNLPISLKLGVAVVAGLHHARLADLVHLESDNGRTDDRLIKGKLQSFQ
jgi:hypothetical protein